MRHQRHQLDLESVQPVVLVGGRSTRFGRDKLMEPWRGGEGGEWLVDQPRLVLGALFGPRVWAVGDCHSAVAMRFERAVTDGFPGSGPLGGVVTALRAANCDAMVLAGDLPRIDRLSVRLILDVAARQPQAEAVVARTDRWEPCIALYRRACEPTLAERLARGVRDMQSALDSLAVEPVVISADIAMNINREQDLNRPWQAT